MTTVTPRKALAAGADAVVVVAVVAVPMSVTRVRKPLAEVAAAPVEEDACAAAAARRAASRITSPLRLRSAGRLHAHHSPRRIDFEVSQPGSRRSRDSTGKFDRRSCRSRRIGGRLPSSGNACRGSGGDRRRGGSSRSGLCDAEAGASGAGASRNRRRGRHGRAATSLPARLLALASQAGCCG